MNPPPPFRLAHLSDLHLPELGELRPWDFCNKRLFGGLNLLLRRRGEHSRGVAELLIEELQPPQVDHVVITGDLTNLSLPGEFRQAAAWLERLGDGRRVSLVPGNHDAYTRAAARGQEFERWFSPWLQSELEVPGPHAGRPLQYPWVKLPGPVALVGLNTARYVPWPFCSGVVGSAQLGRLQVLLRRPELADRPVVLCLHHPLIPHPSALRQRIRGLTDRVALLALLKESTAQLALFGHDHRVQHGGLERSGAPRLLLEGATSTTRISGPTAHLARYSIYTFSTQGLVRVQQRRWDRQAARWEEEEERGARNEEREG